LKLNLFENYPLFEILLNIYKIDKNNYNKENEIIKQLITKKKISCKTWLFNGRE